MKKFYLKKISASKRNNLLTRKAISPITVKYTVEHICNNVKQNGLKAAVDYASKIDGLISKNIYVTQKEFDEAEKELSNEIKNAIKAAYKNINFINFNIQKLTQLKQLMELNAKENLFRLKMLDCIYLQEQHLYHRQC